jgi:hypothetical protein
MAIRSSVKWLLKNSPRKNCEVDRPISMRMVRSAVGVYCVEKLENRGAPKISRTSTVGEFLPLQGG